MIQICALAVVLLVMGLALLPGGLSANGWEHHAIPLPNLLAGLEHESAEVRARAAVSLGIRGERAGVDALLGRLKRPEPVAAVRLEIYTALGHIGDPRAAQALMAGLTSGDRPEFRAAAAEALGKLGQAHSLPGLLAALNRERSLLVRTRIVDALGAFRGPRATATLQALLDHQTPSLRLRAIHALGKNGGPSAVPPLLLSLERAEHQSEILEIVEALGNIGDGAALKPLASLLNRARDRKMRLGLTLAVSQIRDGSAIPVLIGLLEDRDPAVRHFAIEGLEAIRARKSLPPLIALFDRLFRQTAQWRVEKLLSRSSETADSLRTESRIVRALLALQPQRGLTVFLKGARHRDFPRDSSAGVLVSEAVYQLRRISITALGYTRQRAAADFLKTSGALSDPDFRLRGAAVRALGVLGRPGTEQVVLRLLKDTAADVRREAASVLGRIGGPSSAPLLIRALSDTHGLVREQAALSLGYLRAVQAKEALGRLARKDAQQRVRDAASQSLAVLEL